MTLSSALIIAAVAAVVTLLISVPIIKHFLSKQYLEEIDELHAHINRIKDKGTGASGQSMRKKNLYSVHQSVVTDTDTPNYATVLHQTGLTNLTNGMLEPYDYSDLTETVQHPMVIAVNPIEGGAIVAYIDSTEYPSFMNKSVAIRITPPSMRKPIYKLAMVAEYNNLPFEEVQPLNFGYFQDLLEKPPTIQIIDIEGKLFIDSITYYGYKVTYARTKDEPNKLEKVQKDKRATPLH